MAICAATWFSLGSRILNTLGFQQFMVNDEISLELVQEGRDLMIREKRKRQRLDAGSRRRDFNFRETFNDRGALRDGSTSNFDYNTTNTGIDDITYDQGRTLSQEINERFGVSTDISFRPDADNLRPKNIFDDV